MRGEYFFIGIIFLLIGIMLLTKGFSKSGGKSTIKGGAVGFLGPFPLFEFASDKKTLYWLLGGGFLFFLTFRVLQHLQR